MLRALHSAFRDSDDSRFADVDHVRHLLPQPQAWSGDTAWHTTVSRVQLRKVPGLKKLHQFLVDMEHAGLITRQETVSMVPPMFLDLRADSAVLDMCASPGSKTSQIIDAMHALSSAPTGYVVANDVDRKRAYMLVHQVLRFSNNTALVTNHDASVLPSLHVRLANGSRVPHLYDRILCDVPCSGEGTIRKNGDVCTKWTPHGAVGFHKIQLLIAKRGAQLLSVGGRLVYSTCSLNPVENEAVVAELLRFGAGALELVDCSAEMPQLARRPGMLRWPVRGYGDDGYFDAKADVPAHMRSAQVPGSAFAQPDVADLHIERCMRFYPHLQDTGGFFVAVLRKTRSLNDARSGAVDTSAPLAAPKDALDEAAFARPGRHSTERFREDPFLPLLLRSDVCDELRANFDLSDEQLARLSFRKPMFANNGERSTGKPHFVFGESEKLAAIFNSGDVYSSLLVTNGGMKLFEAKKDKSKVDRFRVCPAAATVLLNVFPPHRVVEVTNDEIVKLTTERRCKRSEIASLAPATTALGAVLLKVSMFNGRPFTTPIGVSSIVTEEMVTIIIEQNDLAALRALLGGIDLAVDRTQLTTPVRQRSDANDDDDEDDEDDDGGNNDNADGAGVNDDNNAATSSTPSNKHSRIEE